MQVKTRSTDRLPEPDADSLAHSQKVARHLRRSIELSGGSIGFAEFMQQALYTPGLGYYAAGAAKFGEAGDFVTAPEISPVFGRVVARRIAEAFAAAGWSGRRRVLEFGAGTGAMASQILGYLAENDAMPDEYLILEVSPDLRARQAALLRQQCPELAGRVRWLGDMPRKFSGCVLANEVLDALPVERFRVVRGGVRRLAVGVSNGEFCWVDQPAPRLLLEAVRRIESGLSEPLPEGYVSEICLAAPAWMASVAGMLQDGAMLIFDYGVGQREYYAKDRAGGWLRCYYRHRVHGDPLKLVGIQDLTAWVDFTRIAEAACDAGLRLEAYVTQSQFLLDGGLLEEMRNFASLSTEAQIELSRQVKVLTMPGEMGETIKCMLLTTPGVDWPGSVASADRSHVL